MTVHDDDLNDVSLENVRLVTSNWRNWQVPVEAGNFDSVYDWWTYLHVRDMRLPPRAAAYVKELIDVCPTRPRGRPAGGVAVGGGNRGRAALLTEKLLELGFTFDQLERVTGLTAEQMFGPQMLAAWQMISAGRSATETKAVHPGVPLTVLRRLQKIVDGEPVQREHPVEWRQQLFDLMDSGLGVTEAAKALSERHGTEIKYHTAYAWVKRHRKPKRVAS